MSLSFNITLERKPQHFNFSVKDIEASRIGVIGTSGAGKTTLLRCLAGLEKSEQQQVLLNKVKPKNLAYVTQNAALFPHMTIQQNLQLGMRLSDLTADHHWNLLGRMGLLSWLKKRPAQLSGGQQARVAIARALLQQPDLLLMDEPFAALDTTTRSHIIELIDEHCATYNIPFVLVSHQLSDIAQLTEHCLVIDHGKVIKQGLTPAILSNQLTEQYLDKNDIASVLPFFAERWHAQDQLMQLKLIDHTGTKTELDFWLPINEGLAQQRCYLQISAFDIVLSHQAFVHASVQNHFTGTVHSVTADNTQVTVQLSVMGHSLQVFITHRAQRQCRFKKGDLVFAYVKAMSLAFDRYR